MTVRDTRLLSRALVERWPITEQHRAAIVSVLLRILADPNASNRERISAAKALMTADGNNLQQQQIDLNDEQDRRLRLLELARRIPASQLAQLASRNGINAQSGSEQPEEEKQTEQE